MKALIAFFILIASGMTQAACWKEIYSDKKTDIYIDACSIAQTGAQKKAWFRQVYAEARKTDTYPNKEYDETKFLSYFNCAAKTAVTVKSVDYGPEPDNEVVNTFSINPKLAIYDEYIPDSVGEIEFEAVCKIKNNK